MRSLPALAAAGLILAGCSKTPVPAAGILRTMADDLAGQLEILAARTSMYAKHLPSGKTIEVRADQPMNTLSVIRIPIMIQAFRDVEARRASSGEPRICSRRSGLKRTRCIES